MMIEEAYSKAFGKLPGAVAHAHGRVNLLGEHIDYNGGMVLPTAINNQALVAVDYGDGDADEIYSGRFEETVKRAIDSPYSEHWSDYVAGALAKARELNIVSGSVRLAVESDVPHGAGLSSSAAVIVATLKAVLGLAEQPVDNVRVALWAQAVENDYIGVPVGIMDQMAVAVAGNAQALALDTVSLDYSLVDLPADYHFAVMHSGITRKLEDGRYAERRYECEAAAKALGADYLCQLTVEQYGMLGTLSGAEQRRARHAFTEHQRVLSAKEALEQGELALFGRLMDESHVSMRDDFEMSTPEIDRMVEVARQHGAIGARLTGGGFGGCIVACVPKAGLQGWIAAMERDFSAARYVC
jgi:galactokinase